MGQSPSSRLSSAMSSQAPPSPEAMAFLQTLVSQPSSTAQERTDSDKENDNRLGVIQEEAGPSGTSDVKMNSGGGTSQNQDSMWDDFYNEDDFKSKKNQNSLRPSSASTQRKDDKIDVKIVEGDVKLDDGLDDLPEEDEDEISKDLEGGEGKSDSFAGEDSGSPNTQKRKKKKKRLFQRVSTPLSGRVAPPTAQGGSHPDLSQPDREGHAGQLETMSETSGRGHRRRLNRRKQVAPPTCAGPSANGDMLAQKYEELQQLMVKPLVTPSQAVQQTRAQLRRLQGLSQQYANSAHQVASLPPTGGHGQRRVRQGQNQPRQAFVELGGENAEEGYTTLRTVQVTNHVTGHVTPHHSSPRPSSAHPARKRPTSAQRNRRPFSAGHRRDNTNTTTTNNSNNRTRRLSGSRSRSGAGRGGGGGGSDSSAKGSARSEDDDTKKYNYDSDQFESGSEGRGRRKRSVSKSPGRDGSNPTDMHLKHSNNPALRKWLKQKDRDHRKQKAAERKKLREEREEKQEEERKKQETSEKGEEVVNKWMKMKRREALQKAKEDRKRMRQEEEALYEKDQHQDHTRSLRTKSMDLLQQAVDTRPQSAAGSAPVNPPTSLPPQPPSSKFVYKRPVSGRVRLMKWQQGKKEDAKKTEQEKRAFEHKLAEEKARKMRMSYDQWLIKKRGDDYSKRQEAARQRSLATSDPELERIVPEVARRRIQNIQRGKRRINTGLRKSDAEVNGAFGGGDFGGSEDDGAQGAARLQVSGTQKSLRQRPASASPSVPNPQMSRSPRRPMSAHPRVNTIMNSEEGAGETSGFKLPFPVEQGVPKHVRSRQEKLFSPTFTQQRPSSVQAVTSQDSMTASSVNTTSRSEVRRSARSKVKKSSGQVKEAVSNGNNEDNTVDGLEGETPGKSFFVTDGVDADTPLNGINEDTPMVPGEGDNGVTDEKNDGEGEDSNRTEDREKSEGVEESGDGENVYEPLEEPEMEEEVDEDLSQKEQEKEQEEEKDENEDGDKEEKEEDEVTDDDGVDKDEAVDNETTTNGEAEKEKQDGSPEEEEQMETGQSSPEEPTNESADQDKDDGPADLKPEAQDDLEKATESTDETKAQGEVTKSSSSLKHVSFQEEAEVFEETEDPEFFEDDLEFEDENKDNDDDDEEAEDERGGFIDSEITPRDTDDDAF